MIREMFSPEKYTTEELNARLKFFIGIVLGLTLFGIVFVVLYSLIFVTQPMNGMSPVDNKFFELIIPIATFLTGTLSGIMLAGDDKDLRAKAIDAASGVNKPGLPPSSPTTPGSAIPRPTMPPPPGMSTSTMPPPPGIPTPTSASMPPPPTMPPPPVRPAAPKVEDQDLL
jgi:hypothetical protein